MAVGNGCCGRCCSVIVRNKPIGTEYWYPLALEKLQSYEEGILNDMAFWDDDMLFLVANLERITREEALKLNPDALLILYGHENFVLYTCKQYDAKTKTCKLESKGFMPPMCRAYHKGPKNYYPSWCERRDITWL